MPNDTPAPTAPSGEEQTMTEPLLTVEQTLGFFASAIKSGEAWTPICAEALQGAYASLSTERARMERALDEAQDAIARMCQEEDAEAGELRVAFGIAPDGRSLRDQLLGKAAEVSRLTSELARVRGALTGLHGEVEGMVQDYHDYISHTQGGRSALAGVRTKLHAAQLALCVTPDATTRREG